MSCSWYKDRERTETELENRTKQTKTQEMRSKKVGSGAKGLK